MLPPKFTAVSNEPTTNAIRTQRRNTAGRRALRHRSPKNRDTFAACYCEKLCVMTSSLVACMPWQLTHIVTSVTLPQLVGRLAVRQ